MHKSVGMASVGWMSSRNQANVPEKSYSPKEQGKDRISHAVCAQAKIVLFCCGKRVKAHVKTSSRGIVDLARPDAPTYLQNDVAIRPGQ